MVRTTSLQQVILTFRQTPRALRLLRQANPRLAVLLPVLILAGAPLPALSVYCTKYVIDAVAALLHSPGPAQYTAVAWFMGLMLGAGLAQGLLGGLTQLLESRMRAQLSYSIEHAVLERASQLDLAFYEDPASYDRMARAQRETSSRPYTILSSLFDGLRNVVSLTSFVALLVGVAWWTPFLVVVMTIPGFLVQGHLDWLNWRMSYDQTSMQRRMGYVKGLLTSGFALKEVRLLGLAPYLTGQWTSIFRQIYQRSQEIATRQFVLGAALLLLQTLSGAGFYVYLIYRTVTDPAVTIGSFLMYTQAMQQASTFVSGLFRSLNALGQNHLYLAQLFEFLEQRPRITCPGSPRPVPEPFHSIRLESVSFRYPGAPCSALHDVSLEIRRGQRVALVGENGAGKTTLVKLLLRLYDPDEGRITVDGIDLRDMDPGRWHRQISAIFQDFLRFLTTVRENIGFGDVDRLDRPERIRQAAECAGATRCIEQLPGTWDCMLGRLFDGGQELSLGEWQRIAMARALMKDAPLLVLDEPSASLDAKEEHWLFRRLEEIARDRATLLISHRLSTVRNADRIFVMNAGRLVEVGRHEELMDLNGCYADLFSRQASGYMSPSPASHAVDRVTVSP